MKKISSELPMELVADVLVRLPVKSLVRCKCVCKAWCSLISSPDFVSMHRTRLHNNDDHPFLLTLYHSERKTLCALRSSLTYKKVVGKDYALPVAKHLEDLKNYYMYKICYADGLVFMFKTFTSEILLWNPSLGKTLELPPIRSDVHSAVFGVGFDTARNDYKVVAIGKYPRVSVQIYELRAPFWRTITNCNCEKSIIRKVDFNGVLMEGTIHWIAQDSGDISSHIVLFDLNNEVFNYIMLPQELGEYCEHKHPVMYRGKLGLLHVFDRHLCSLWVTEEDQAPGAWVKLYQVNLGIDDPLYYRHHFHVLSFKENGQLIFATKGGGVKLYDFESQEMKKLLKTYLYGMMHSIPYEESSVLI